MSKKKKKDSPSSHNIHHLHLGLNSHVRSPSPLRKDAGLKRWKKSAFEEGDKRWKGQFLVCSLLLAVLRSFYSPRPTRVEEKTPLNYSASASPRSNYRRVDEEKENCMQTCKMYFSHCIFFPLTAVRGRVVYIMRKKYTFISVGRCVLMKIKYLLSLHAFFTCFLRNSLQ